jgi:hypothetical protein
MWIIGAAAGVAVLAALFEAAATGGAALLPDEPQPASTDSAISEPVKIVVPRPAGDRSQPADLAR